MDTGTQAMVDQAHVSQPPLTTYAELAAQGKEEAIAYRISRMWETHRSMEGSVKDSKRELRALGKTLGEALFYMYMKVLLDKPGRNGKWSEFLREMKIPRTSGDRLVAAYERSLNRAVNCTEGAIQSPTQDEVRKLCSAVWSRASRRLTTPDSVFWFIRDFALVSGVRHEVCEDGILVFRSPREAGEEPPSLAATPPVVGQTAAVAGASDGDVQ
jgi:hypothetical protein